MAKEPPLTLAKEITPEQAWTMPLEEIDRFYSNEDLQTYADAGKMAARADLRSGAWALEQRALLAELRQGAPLPAMEDVYCEPGEHVMENVVSAFGICRLRILRLGAPVHAQVYWDQLAGRVGVNGLQLWNWTQRENGQELHVLLLVWKQE